MKKFLSSRIFIYVSKKLVIFIFSRKLQAEWDFIFTAGNPFIITASFCCNNSQKTKKKGGEKNVLSSLNLSAYLFPVTRTRLLLSIMVIILCPFLGRNLHRVF